MEFTRAELDGVPDDFLNAPQIQKSEDGQKITIMANEAYQAQAVLDNAKNEVTRRRVYVARDSLASGINGPLLNEIITLRFDIARRLGYCVVGRLPDGDQDGEKRRRGDEFLDELIKGIQSKFAAEWRRCASSRSRTRATKRRRFMSGTGASTTTSSRNRNTRSTPTPARVLPMEKTIAGMFRIYEGIFGLKFTQLEAPYKWVDNLQLWLASDAQTGEPMGLFYLDLYPREGKYNHFAQFGIIEGRLLEDGKYQRPTVALVCNFPPPSADKPVAAQSSRRGDAFPRIWPRHAFNPDARDLRRFAGTSVPRDFVEAPSQMLENWVWDQKVLDSFAADYRDPTKKIPGDLIER